MNRNLTNTNIEPPIPGVTIDFDANALVDALNAHGHLARTLTQTSGLSIIQIKELPSRNRGDDDDDDDDDDDEGRRTILIGGADHRRDGTVDGR